MRSEVKSRLAKVLKKANEEEWGDEIAHALIKAANSPEEVNVAAQELMDWLKRVTTAAMQAVPTKAVKSMMTQWAEGVAHGIESALWRWENEDGSSMDEGFETYWGKTTTNAYTDVSSFLKAIKERLVKGWLNHHADSTYADGRTTKRHIPEEDRIKLKETFEAFLR